MGIHAGMNEANWSRKLGRAGSGIEGWVLGVSSQSFSIIYGYQDAVLVDGKLGIRSAVMVVTTG